MKTALYLPPFGEFADANLLAEVAREAEDAGWDGFFIWDHILMEWPAPVCDPWIALTAVALNTTHLKFGPMITPIPRRRPWKLARETVTLDRLSGGRLILGVGSGYSGKEFNDLNEKTDVKTRAAMLDEGLDILTGLWSGEPFSYDGNHYQINDVTFQPTPHQSPRIPIWVAGFLPYKAPMRRAARWDGVFALPIVETETLTTDEIRQIKGTIQQYRTDDAPIDIVFSGASSGENTASDIARQTEYEEAGVTWWFENINPWRFGWDMKSAWPLNAMRNRIRKGPPITNLKPTPQTI
ncbi:MAG: LLM class flavin-dependent oxidoreductase [Chloroflexi bacterium]|nr:LLM class flavin-dependent oxidoreductase [Chloroflexota bacterium]